MRNLIGLKDCCLDRPYDLYYLILDTDVWSWELDFELRHRLGPVRRLLGWHSTELIFLPRQDRGSLSASITDVYSSYKLIRPFEVPTPSVCASAEE